MDFFNSAIDVLQTLVIALGGGLCVWGGINLLEGYGPVSYTHLDVYKRQTSMNSAVSIPGPMRRNRKVSSTKFISPNQRIRNWPVGQIIQQLCVMFLSQELPLKLIGTESYNGVVDLVYERR